MVAANNVSSSSRVFWRRGSLDRTKKSSLYVDERKRKREGEKEKEEPARGLSQFLNCAMLLGVNRSSDSEVGGSFTSHRPKQVPWTVVRLTRGSSTPHSARISGIVRFDTP